MFKENEKASQPRLNPNFEYLKWIVKHYVVSLYIHGI